ncbi:MAG: hypothetical protein CFE32_22930 [Alphaproteobacteria bacterium PA3]|nr:MAG: hypothetical protein CFE32_22930 [Alphaproteobacteria bacterium PA3]
MSSPSILWFRQDLRLHDQAALVGAAGEGAFVPIYILDDDTPGDRLMGGAQRWWLHHSLERLKAALPNLVLRRGNSMAELAKLAAELGTTRIHAIRHYEPWWREAESELATEFDLVLHGGNHLALPETILTGGGTR